MARSENYKHRRNGQKEEIPTFNRNQRHGDTGGGWENQTQSICNIPSSGLACIFSLYLAGSVKGSGRRYCCVICNIGSDIYVTGMFTEGGMWPSIV